MEEIYKRRSVRQYTDRKISDNDIKAIVKAGMNAPSSMNAEPWEFVVVDDKAVLSELASSAGGTRSVGRASHAIVICAPDHTDLIDIGITAENILLEATHLGIGSVPLDIYPHESTQTIIKNLLSIPSDYSAFFLIGLGYAAETPEPNNKYMETKFHLNKW